jgi:hypothetical protein
LPAGRAHGSHSLSCRMPSTGVAIKASVGYDVTWLFVGSNGNEVYPEAALRPR